MYLRRRYKPNSKVKQFTYGDIVGYLEQYHRYMENYNSGKTTKNINDHLKPYIDKYGDIPHTDADCRMLEEVQSELYTRIFSLSESGDDSMLPSKTIEKLYKQRFYDPGVMEFIKCSLMSMFTNKSLDKISRFWIHNIKRIGEPSADGEVSLAKIGGYSELVVFKISKKPENVYSTIYEGLIGHEVNKLRRMGNVNFAYTYGVIKCGHKDMCKPEDTVLMQEFVKGVSYESYVRSIDDPYEFISAILQLTFSLNWAYNSSRFQHLDLHNQNVMARETGRSSFYVPYQHNGQDVYVKSKKVMTIIDFGRSAIRINSGNGSNGEVIYSADTPDSNPDGLSPLADIFKLLGFTLYRADIPITEKVREKVYRFNGGINEREVVKEPATNTTIIQLVEELMKFFVDIRELKNHQLTEDFRDSYYILYGIDRDLTFDDFLNYIRFTPSLSKYWNELVRTSVNSNRVLECRGDCILPASLIPTPSGENVTNALDFLIRVNEGWPVKVNNWDKLISEMEAYKRDSSVVGLRDLLRGAKNVIPKQYHTRIERLSK